MRSLVYQHTSTRQVMSVECTAEKGLITCGNLVDAYGVHGVGSYHHC